mmetsp:Transcript_2686/g.7261  ORF Transcript_2686/g.7261 Transcript_2686/m.7261 type:complete len:256 (-) Transcript_2686:1753-2520(-)
MSLISRAHNQLQARALADLLSSCPLVLVYQTLGNVRSSELVRGVSLEVAKHGPDVLLLAKAARVKNTIATSARSSDLPAYFQASNVLLGWQLVGSQLESVNVSASEPIVSRRDDSLTDLLGSLAGASASCSPFTATVGATRASLPQKSLSAAIDVSLKLPNSAPVALLAGFYRGQHVRMAHLHEWKTLDDRVVYPQLIAQLDATAHAVVSPVDRNLEQMISMLDACQPTDLLHCLETMAERKGAVGTTPNMTASA